MEKDFLIENLHKKKADKLNELAHQRDLISNKTNSQGRI